jgi:ABC-2 type transport system ATP-binding protein
MVMASLAIIPIRPASAAGPRVEDNIVVHSYDGVAIAATFMLPESASSAQPVPAVLMTHGFGGSRVRTPTGMAATLLDNGYAVLTWDSRGFGQSGGEATMGGPNAEVKDAQALIDYLSTREEVQQDGAGDPRLGWVGGSNAGGIQLNTAGVDHRVDAITPQIAWGDFVQDVIPNGVFKERQADNAYLLGMRGAVTGGLTTPTNPKTGVYAKELHVAWAEMNSGTGLSKASRAWLRLRSTTRVSSSITAPTLIIQGTVDTLVPLEDGFTNYVNVVGNGTPAKLIAFCGGHSPVCPYPAGNTELPTQRVIAWLDRYVKNLPVDTGPSVEWQAQDGVFYGATSYPLAGATFVEGTPFATPVLLGPGPGGGDGLTDGNPAPPRDITAHTATRAQILAPSASTVDMVGIPRVQLTGSVIGASAQVFFELVDVAPDGTRVTIDDQVMPLKLANGNVTSTINLHGVAWKLFPGHALELEVTTGSTPYQAPRTGAFEVQLQVRPLLPLAPAA